MKTEEGGLPLSCLTANRDVSNGSESTLLQTAPDSADAQWVSPADHREGEIAALGRTLHWRLRLTRVVVDVTERWIPQQGSRADGALRVWLQNSV